VSSLNDELLARISRTVDERRDTIARLLVDLVAIPSVTGDEGAVQNRVEQEFRARGLEVDRWEATRDQMADYLDHVGEQQRWEGRPNVAGIRCGTGGGRSLLLNAHIDTVEPGDPATWTRSPSGEIAEGRVYGRGSCDMKGGLVTHLAALDVLEALNIRLAGDVSVIATVGEENGGLGALSAALRGYRADGAVITEPTRLAAILACEGSIIFRLTVPGKSAHAAVRDEGVSAVEKFIPIFQDLQEFERERNASLNHPLYALHANKVPINVGIVHAGEWASTVPESLTAEIRVGFLPGEDLYEFWEVVQQRIMAVANHDPWLREHPPTMEWFSGQFSSAEASPDEPIVRALLAAHERVTGECPPIEGATYGADMRHFIRFANTPTIMYGAGDVTVAHHADEYIDIDELLTATKTLACLLVDWCGGAE
jgi:acetylornithine deacetylase